MSERLESAPHQPIALGELLKQAREKKRFTEDQIAAHLHLSADVIRMIESQDFRNAPPHTFLRGYIRTYSRFLELNETEVTEALANLGLLMDPAPSHTPLPNLYPFRPSRSQRYWLHIGTIVL